MADVWPADVKGQVTENVLVCVVKGGDSIYLQQYLIDGLDSVSYLADHVSGDSDLAELTGAQIYIHQAAKAAFEHHSLNDGDVIALGTVELRVQHTPEHTLENTRCWLLTKPVPYNNGWF